MHKDNVLKETGET